MSLFKKKLILWQRRRSLRREAVKIVLKNNILFVYNLVVNLIEPLTGITNFVVYIRDNEFMPDFDPIG
jgi:hypothetical protein